ncbi:MAG: hypothetical protein A4E42_02081 [Methanoregulaceae archaeon PtaU1.Bin222]|nr:MAG: hypothetical protein A4E42_02081 [Methanoregulaceae archaeon PtaU1.Bin222]
MRWMEAFSTSLNREKTIPAVRYLPASPGKNFMTGIRERSGLSMARVPSSIIRPWQAALEISLPISRSSIPSARESELRDAVTFITPLPPGRSWKKRSEFVVLAIFGASNSPQGLSSTSITADLSRIISMNSRNLVMPPCYAVRCELHSDKSSSLKGTFTVLPSGTMMKNTTLFPESHTHTNENRGCDFLIKNHMIPRVTHAYRMKIADAIFI